jgi:hypothetical protein
MHPLGTGNIRRKWAVFRGDAALSDRYGGGNIVATIGLTRLVAIAGRFVALALRPARAQGYPDEAGFALLPSRGADHIVKAAWTNPSTIIWCAPIHAIPG